MSKSSGSAAGGVMVTLFGGSMFVNAVSESSYALMVPGAIVVFLGLIVISRSKKTDKRPRTPEGFAPARPDEIPDGLAPEQPAADQQVAPEQQAPEQQGRQPVLEVEQGRESSAIGALTNEVYSSDRGSAVPPAHAPRAVSTARPSNMPSVGSETPYGRPESQDSVSVPPDLEVQVVQLAKEGRTIEAIEKLREATGMELYEASQYIRTARRSGG